MKKYPVGTYFYDFDCDPELLISSFNNVKKLDQENKIFWYDTPNSHNASAYGYLDQDCTVPFYDKPLFDWLNRCIDRVAQESFPGVELVICDSWLHKMSYGQSAPSFHNHIRSIYSGILYFTSHYDSSTHFSLPNRGHEIYNSVVHFGNLDLQNFNLSQIHHIFRSTPVAGKLVIFPSDALHNIPIHNDPHNIRYTLAFNTFINGEQPGGSSTRLHVKTKSSEEKYSEWINSK